jgi:Carboxypeptidase regulatory-like domain
MAPLISLPSRQPALSTAANGHKVLAIDSQHTLFYSEDDGQHWINIPTQWRGRAVKVNLARPAGPLAQNTAITAGYSTNVGPLSQNVAVAANFALTGTVTDATGAAISGVTITLSNTSTKTSRTVTSDLNGQYTADNLTPGSYQLEAAAPGFQKQQLAVNVAPAQQNQANLTLNVGAVTEAVTVEAAQEAIPLATTSDTLAVPRVALKKAAPKAPAKPAAIPLFEITTDDSSHWTSPDGKIWTQK